MFHAKSLGAVVILMRFILKIKEELENLLSMPPNKRL